MMKIVQENTSKEDSENSFVDVFLSTISYKGKYNLFEKMNLKINCVNVNNGDILKSFEYTIKPENFSKEFNVFHIDENFLSVPENQIKNIKFEIKLSSTFLENKRDTSIFGDILTSSFIYLKKLKSTNNIYKYSISNDIKIDFSFNRNQKKGINRNSNSNETTNSSNNIKEIQNIGIVKLQNEELNYCDLPSFCEAFYIASLPENNIKHFLENQFLDNKFSQCNHKNCSLLPSYNSDIIFRYPIKDKSKNNFTLSELFSSLSFPYGVKICFENGEPSQNDFFFVSTNEFNEHNYVYVHYTYLKMKFEDFKKKYKIDPVKDFLNMNIANNISDLNEKFQIGQDLILREYIYIPFAYCLVSKFPYQNEMKMCIDSIIKIQNDKKELNLFLKYIIYEIPNINFYNKNRIKLIFYLPKQINPIIIDNKLHNKGIIIPNNSMKLLFEYFTLDNILKIVRMILGSQKLLFVCNGKEEYNNMCLIQLSFINILYPLRMKFTFIPNLSYNLLKFLQSFMPFIMGIDINYLEFAKKEYIEKDNLINIIYLKKNRKSYFEPNYIIKFGNFPKFYYNKLRNNLNLIRNKIIKNEDFNVNYDSQIRKCFLDIFLLIFGDYEEFTSIIDNVVYFNENFFLKNSQLENYKFEKEIINTEMFNDFIQRNCISSNSEMRDFYFNKLVLSYNIKHNNKVLSEKRSSSIGERRLGKKISDVGRKENNCNSLEGTIYEINISQYNSSSRNSSLNKNQNYSNNQSGFNFGIGNKNIFLIPPYFLNQPIIFNDLNKINELIRELFKDEEKKNDNEKTFITSLPEIIEEDSKIFRYQIPHDITANYLKKIEKKNKQFNSYQNMFDEKITLLDDIMRKILTSKFDESKSNNYIETIDLKSNKIRNHFCYVLFQEKFDNLNNNFLTVNSFNLLSKLIFNALLYLTNTECDFKNNYYLIKSLFHYYKREKNKNIFLFEKFNKHTPFEIWLNKDFWEYCLNEEIKKFELYDQEDIIMKILEFGSIMNDLNINIREQISLINFISEKHLDNKDSIIQIEDILVKQYNNKKIAEANE